MINVLYVDDDLLNLMSFEVLFKDKFKVFTASNGDKALEIVDKNEISVVITDQKMPKMSGIELLNELANKNPNILRIIHSGYGDSDEIEAAIKKGIVNYFLDKPLNENLLMEIIEKYFGLDKKNF